MPESAKRYFMAMKKYSWLESYTSIDGIRFHFKSDVET